MKPYYQDDSETISEWSGCYDNGWQGEITPKSFSHPAKFSRGLIRRIYKHALEQGWLVPGAVVADPFGGVALGALDAMWNGLSWVGVEVEPKFVALGQQNITLWQRKYGSKEGWGTARIIRGDSRRLAQVIAGADLICSSPPYAESIGTKDQKFWDDHNDRLKNWNGATKVVQDYGSSPGQLGAMKEGDFDCVVGSPPFSQAQTGGGFAKADSPLWDKLEKQHNRSFTGASRRVWSRENQGESQGQLGCLPEGRFEAVISSPPYEHPEGHPSLGSVNKDRWGSDGRDIVGRRDLTAHYGENQPDNFWSAAREIVAQCHAILKPGGHAIWVCKDFVRKSRRVPFSDRWQALCESVGFRLLCRHRAMLVSNHGAQGLLEGGSEQLTTARKSFFRRLAERKGSPRIDHEDVMCLERI